MLKKLTALLVTVILLLSCAAAEEASPTDVSALPEGVHALPIDLSGGMPLTESGLDAENWTYSDPSISVAVTVDRVDGCDYWIADIVIADASQLRTKSAASDYNSAATEKGQSLAAKVNAVIAIAGDYYTGTGKGMILRQGVLYKNILEGVRDVLAIDANGDFHVFFQPQQDEVPTEIDGVPVINAFYFGPVLVNDGKVIENVNINRDTDRNMVATLKKQRVALCQVDELHYKIIVCGPPARRNAGMTLQRFADLVAEQGVKIAYNMDGGDSAMLLLNAVKLNDVHSQSVRKIEDIIYFASAYDGGTQE